MPEDIKCPICGTETVERTAKKGQNIGSSFYVCNCYPECKGKVAIHEQTGTAIPSKGRKMFCSNCGVQLPDDSRFCSECGTYMDAMLDDT